MQNARPQSVAEIKSRLKETTLCAACPQASWEAVWEKNGTDPDAILIQAITPVEKTPDGLHIACYCMAKGRYVPGYVYLCQGYDDAMQEQAATRLDQNRARA